MSSESKQFSLTVWRPSRLARDLAQYSHGSEGATFTRVHAPEHFYEAAYSWSTREDIWGGVVEQGTTENLRKLLMITFSPTTPPEKRDMNALSLALKEMKPLLGNDSVISWQDLSEQAEELDVDSITRANLIVALFHHLSWIHSVYQDIPGVSITIR